MNNYISILRGINVSGKNKIKMADLNRLYEGLGFQDVVTYIQSGNVVFKTAVNQEAKLITTIEQAIEAQYNFHVPVQIRTRQEMKAVVDNCPFGSLDLAENGTKVLVTFLSEIPSAEKIELIQQYVKAPEALVVRGREVYLHCPNGYGRSKLSNRFLESKLKVTATTRNWRSVQKLYAMFE